MTPNEIADLARTIRSGFPRALETYRKWTKEASNLRFVPDLRDTERKEVVQQLHFAEEGCEIWDQPLCILLECVKVALPDTWRAARSLREAIFWRHNEIDLTAIVEDLLRIEEDAALAGGHPVAPIDPDKQTPNVDALLDEADLKIKEIAENTSLGGEEKMQEIIRIDRRYEAKFSTWWSDLLGVRDATIRGYDEWKRIQAGKRSPD